MSRTEHTLEPEGWQGWLESAGLKLERWWHYFSPEALRVFLASRTDLKYPPKFRPAATTKTQRELVGRRLVSRYNCVGCHVVDGKGGAIRARYEDSLSLAPPILTVPRNRTPPRMTNLSMAVRQKFPDKIAEKVGKCNERQGHRALPAFPYIGRLCVLRRSMPCAH